MRYAAARAAFVGLLLGLALPTHAADDLDRIRQHPALSNLNQSCLVPLQCGGDSFARQMGFDQATRQVLQNAPECRRMRIAEYGLPSICWQSSTDTGVDLGLSSCKFRDIWAARLHGTSDSAGNADACDGIDCTTFVVGPASSTDGDFAQFDGTTGKLLQDGGYGPNSFMPLLGPLYIYDPGFFPALNFMSSDGNPAHRVQVDLPSDPVATTNVTFPLSGDIATTSQLHNAVTLDTDADTLLSLSTQALGLDTQAANTVLAGRVDAGTALVPTFRALVAADIPSLSSIYQPLDSDLTAIAGLSATNDDIIQRKAGAWTNRTMAQLTADLVMPVVGSPAGGSLLTRDFSTRGSSGVLDGTLTYVTGSGSNVAVAAGEGYLRTTNDQQGDLKFITWGASPTNTIPAPAAGQETTRFIGVEYNSGTPQVTVRTSFNWNWYDDFPLARVSYNGTTLRVINTYAHAEDTANLARKYLRRVFPFQRETAPEGTGGLELSESGTRNLNMSAGTVWHGFNQIPMTAITAGTFTTYYSTAADTFTATTGQTQWPNDSYNNGTALTTMTNNKFGVLWVYIDLSDNTLNVRYGTGQYTTVALAEAEGQPSIPAHLTYHGKLIARLIFQKTVAGVTSATEILSAWTNPIGASVAYQPLDTALTSLSAVTTAYVIGDIPYADSTTTMARLADVAVGRVLASGGVGAAPAWSANPQLTSIELGHATDTTIARSGAGDLTVEGNAIYRAGGTDVPVTDGGTGRSTGTTAYALVATGTTATGAQQTLAAGATTEILVGGGASALPVWTTAEGTGAPVRKGNPTLTTPNIGAATATSINWNTYGYIGAVAVLGWPAISLNGSLDLDKYNFTSTTGLSLFINSPATTTITQRIGNAHGIFTDGTAFAPEASADLTLGKSTLKWGGLWLSNLTSGRVVIADADGKLVDDADLTFATDTLTATKIVGSTSITDSGLTAGRVTFAGTGGLLSDDADMTFATDTLTVTGLAVGTTGAGFRSSSVVIGAEAGVIKFAEQAANAAAPTNGTEIKMYMKADKIVFEYQDGATLRYKYLDMTGTGVTWVAGTP